MRVGIRCSDNKPDDVRRFRVNIPVSLPRDSRRLANNNGAILLDLPVRPYCAL